MSTLDLLIVNAPSRPNIYGSLIQLSAIEVPVWAGLIACHCMNNGFSVQILDAEAEGLTAGETARRIIDVRPRLAAFSIYGQQPSASTQCLPMASAVCRAMKEMANDEGIRIPTLAFGTHPSALPERTLREELFDFVCQGEGVEPILRLLEVDWRNSQTLLSTIPGLWRRGPGGLPALSFGTSRNISDLDAELPGQAWELLSMKRYRGHNWHLWTAQREVEVIATRDFTVEPTGRERYAGGYASVQTSLGCPFKCSFCCINAPFGGAGIRYWSPENVVSQINHLFTEYGISNFKIPDEMFVLNRQHVLGICNLIDDLSIGDRLNTWAYARIDTVKDTELLDRMRRAGFRWLGIGIESGSKHVRDGVEKGRFTENDIHHAVERVRSAGICVGANYIFGLPDDTRESMQKTLDLACELNTEWANFYCAMAYPGSALHVQVSRERPEWLPENNPCGWIGYSQHAPECMPLPTATLSAAQVLAFRDEAFMRYFSRHEYQVMLTALLGDEPVQQVLRMLAVGKPKRNLLS